VQTAPIFSRQGRQKIGVTEWSTVEPIAIPFQIEVRREKICKDGTVKPWNSIGNKLVLRDQLEWVWVEKIQGLRAQGTSLRKIADFLVEQKVPTKNGGRWFAKTVSQILKFNEAIQSRHENETNGSL